MSEWKLVPVEPTLGMEDAFLEAASLSGEQYSKRYLDGIKAAIAAAPSPEWVEFTSRAPTVDDADESGLIWTWTPRGGVVLMGYDRFAHVRGYWMPKPRAQPPEPPTTQDPE